MVGRDQHFLRLGGLELRYGKKQIWLFETIKFLLKRLVVARFALTNVAEYVR
jgi:hypothetical protein